MILTSRFLAFSTLFCVVKSFLPVVFKRKYFYSIAATEYSGNTKAELRNKLDPTKTAILLIEYQNEFAAPGGKLHEAVKPVMDQNLMLSNTMNVVKMARDKGAKIFHAPILFSSNYRELASDPYGILGFDIFDNIRSLLIHLFMIS
jgi:hypothetical protein